MQPQLPIAYTIAYTHTPLIFYSNCRKMQVDVSILLFRGLLLFGPDFFFVQNTPISLSLSRDRTKGQQSKNTFLTPTKILPTK